MKKKSCSIVHTNNETNLLCFNSFINLLILEALLDVVKVGWLMRLTILHLSYF
jgi:hypothetical protein